MPTGAKRYDFVCGFCGNAIREADCYFHSDTSRYVVRPTTLTGFVHEHYNVEVTCPSCEEHHWFGADRQGSDEEKVPERR